jgi:antitoxin component of MazEF toxin-antitoxin module
MTTATVRKWGNSLAIRLPHEVTDRVNFDDGFQVEMLVTENKEILLRPAFPAANDQDAPTYKLPEPHTSNRQFRIEVGRRDPFC